MNTLRVKIAVLMVIVIVSVVFSLTLVLFYLLGPPKRIIRSGRWRSRCDAAARSERSGIYVRAGWARARGFKNCGGLQRQINCVSMAMLGSYVDPVA